MRSITFTSLILLLCLGWMHFYSMARERFNGVDEFKELAVRTHRELQEERLAWNVERDQFLQFRYEVATLMPEAVKQHGQGLQGYPYRNLASQLTRSQAESVRGLVVKSLFERGREHFRKKNYAQSTKVFKELLEKFSYSSYVTESYFLLSEGYFQQGQLENSVRVIQQMLELFPAHELTGFSLVRLGKIYELQNRNEEAIDIYKTVVRSFPQRDVASQAKSSMRGIEL